MSQQLTEERNMSKIKVRYEDKKLYIWKKRTRVTPLDSQEISLMGLKYGKEYNSYVKVTRKKDMNKVFFSEVFTKENGFTFINDFRINWKEEQIMMVYSIDGILHYVLTSKVNAYKRLIKFYYRMLHVGLSSRKVTFWLMGQYINPHKLQFTEERFCLDEDSSVACHFPVERKKLRLRKMLRSQYIKRVSFNLREVVDRNEVINSNVKIVVNIDGVDVDFRIGKVNRNIATSRYYYAPYKSAYVKDTAVHLRRTLKGNFIFVKRPKESVENTFYFRFMESRPVSWFLYKMGRGMRKIRKQNVNLFYEKLSQQAEEGTFEFFEKVRDESRSKSYFIIDAESKDYDRIKDHKNVVRKYSLKYYYLLYNVTNYIATESPVHLNILRSNNKYFRLCTCERDFIFLQHGITYMKCQGDGSTFGKGKEGEPAYMIVDSEKERDVCVDMLRLNEEQMLKTGMLIFDDIQYKHINQQSENNVTIMLTWRPYEEHLSNFEESTYYKFILQIYDVLQKYVDRDKIQIVPHPKIAHLLRNTSLKDRIWTKSIKEVLEITKLLITDYSSVCYNCFYQGAGVVFYQPDLIVYETVNGPLIPKEEEYVGYRIFNSEELDQICRNGFTNREILLDYWRTPEYENRYAMINEFHDGKNADRIFEQLVRLGKL